MSELAGPSSRVDWTGTFGAVLLPGILVGGLLALAEVIRRRGGRRGWRALALAPLAFAIAPLLRPGAMQSLLTDGLGGGSIGVAGIAVAGGFAVSGRGRTWARIVCGVVAVVLIVCVALTTFFFGGDRLAVTEPRGVWVALTAVSFLLLLALASSIPFRPTTEMGGSPNARVSAHGGPRLPSDTEHDR
jgi:hypothetical protein